jgi:hypothetical protein
MKQITYTRCGDYCIPNLTLSETETKPLGKYGRMRKNYLKEHRPVLWNSMILSEKLYPHLREIDETANRRIEQLMSVLLTSAPAPDKETQQMAWVQHMNTLKAQAEEIILTELIFN